MSHRGTNGAGLRYLGSLAPWTGGFASEPSLEPMRLLMAALGDPQDVVPAIHVTGTNGKGSVSAAVSAILGAAGYRVGLTTSPHLSSIHERIVIDGLPISDRELDRALLEVSLAASDCRVVPTHFEAITAAAFVIFAGAKLDYIVVEVGLGGRLDATNVIKSPLVGVVTTIDYDHEAILGATLDKIGREKAGIIKSGMNIVVGAVPPDARHAIIARAKDMGASIFEYGADFGYKDPQQPILTAHGAFLEINPGLAGEYQLHNMALAAQVCRLLDVEPRFCEKGIREVRWPGRLEMANWAGKPLLIDAAHNPQGIRSFVAYVRSRGLSGLPIVFGVLDTKNWDEMLKELMSVVGEFILVRPDFPRGLDCAVLADKLSCFNVSTSVYHDDYSAALTRACELDSPIIGVLGSIYLIGKIRDLCGIAVPQLWRRA